MTPRILVLGSHRLAKPLWFGLRFMARIGTRSALGAGGHDAPGDKLIFHLVRGLDGLSSIANPIESRLDHMEAGLNARFERLEYQTLDNHGNVACITAI